MGASECNGRWLLTCLCIHPGPVGQAKGDVIPYGGFSVRWLAMACRPLGTTGSGGVGLKKSTYGYRFPGKWLKGGLKHSTECCCAVASTGHSVAHIVVARLQVVTYVLYFGMAYSG